LIPLTPSQLSRRSADYFRKTREASSGKKLEDVLPKGDQVAQDWKNIEAQFDKMNKWFSATDEKGPFMLGDTISWADINMASFLKWIKFILGEESQEWKLIASWNEGRWENLVKAFEKYSSLV